MIAYFARFQPAYQSAQSLEQPSQKPRMTRYRRWRIKSHKPYREVPNDILNGRHEELFKETFIRRVRR